MPIHKIYNSGKMIYYIDHRTETKEEILQTIEDFLDIITVSENKVSILYDFRGVIVDGDIMKKLYFYGKEYVEKRTLKAGILGVEGMKKLLLMAYISITNSKTITVFEGFEEAKKELFRTELAEVG